MTPCVINFSPWPDKKRPKAAEGREKTTQVTDLESTLVVLKPGQVVLIYFLILFFAVSVLSIFCLEHAWKLMGCMEQRENQQTLFRKTAINRIMEDARKDAKKNRF